MLRPTLTLRRTPSARSLTAFPRLTPTLLVTPITSVSSLELTTATDACPDTEPSATAAMLDTEDTPDTELDTELASDTDTPASVRPTLTLRRTPLARSPTAFPRLTPTLLV